MSWFAGIPDAVVVGEHRLVLGSDALGRAALAADFELEDRESDWPATTVLELARWQLDQAMEILTDRFNIDPTQMTRDTVFRRLVECVGGGQRLDDMDSDLVYDLSCWSECVDLWRALRAGSNFVGYAREYDGSITMVVGPDLPELAALGIPGSRNGELEANPMHVMGAAVACTHGLAQLAQVVDGTDLRAPDSATGAERSNLAVSVRDPNYSFRHVAKSIGSLVAYLEHWLATTESETLGDPDAADVAHILTWVAQIECFVAESTTRKGVEEFLAFFKDEPKLSILPSAIARYVPTPSEDGVGHNHVVLGALGRPIEGFDFATIGAARSDLVPPWTDRSTPHFGRIVRATSWRYSSVGFSTWSVPSILLHEGDSRVSVDFESCEPRMRIGSLAPDSARVLVPKALAYRLAMRDEFALGETDSKGLTQVSFDVSSEDEEPIGDLFAGLLMATCFHLRGYDVEKMVLNDVHPLVSLAESVGPSFDPTGFAAIDADNAWVGGTNLLVISDTAGTGHDGTVGGGVVVDDYNLSAGVPLAEALRRGSLGEPDLQLFDLDDGARVNEPHTFVALRQHSLPVWESVTSAELEFEDDSDEYVDAVRAYARAHGVPILNPWIAPIRAAINQT